MSNSIPKLKAVAYARASMLLNQDPELQFAQIRDFVNDNGFTLFKEYSDKGIIGTREKRPALDQLIADAKAGKFQVVIITSIDRIGRCTTHLLNLLAELGASFFLVEIAA